MMCTQGRQGLTSFTYAQVAHDSLMLMWDGFTGFHRRAHVHRDWGSPAEIPWCQSICFRYGMPRDATTRTHRG